MLIRILKKKNDKRKNAEGQKEKQEGETKRDERQEERGEKIRSLIHKFMK